MTSPTSTEETPVPRPKTQRVLNVRLLVETLIAAAVFAAGGAVWYYWQLNRTADAMLDRAEKLIKEGDDRAAAQYYFQYLKIRPENAEVQVLLAETFDRATKDARGKDQAVKYYYQALGVAPPEKRGALRRRLAELLLELRRYPQVEEEARELLQADANDALGWRLKALALYGRMRDGGSRADDAPDALGEAFARAVALNPADAEIAVTLAGLYRENPQWLDAKAQALSESERKAAADRILDALVAADPRSARAYLARHRYRLLYQLSGADDDLAAALEFGPDDPDVLLQAAAESQRAARMARRAGGKPEDVEALWEKARKHYERAIEIDPKREAAYLGLGDVAVERGKPEEAVEAWTRGLKHYNPESVELNFRLADLYLHQDRLDDAEKTLGALARIIERLAPLLPSPAKLALQRSHDLLQGKWLARKGRRLEAIPLLRSVAFQDALTGPEAAQSFQACLWLGSLYSGMGQWDAAAAAYERAASLNPSDARTRVRAAEAWASAGRPESAAALYRQALALADAPEIRLALAQIELQRVLRLPKEERNWTAFDKALAEVKQTAETKSLAKPWRLPLLAAECALARGAARDALVLLEIADKENPEDAELLQQLAAANERLGRRAEADRMVERLEKLKDQAGAACLLRARLFAARNEFGQANRVLTEGLETLPADMRPALRRELLRTALAENQWDRAREQLTKLREMEPDNLEWTVHLAELAFDAKQYEEVASWEKELRKLEGPDGVFQRFMEARRLLARASGPDDPALDRVAELESQIMNLRPSWPKAYWLRGLLAEARGQIEPAVEAYREAIRLGESQPSLFERLIPLLIRANRPEEADRCLSLLRDRIADSDKLASLEIAVAARRGQFDRALDSARKNVERHPDDAPARLWLGQLLLTAGKSGEAESEMKKAVELAPADPRALEGLFGFYVQTRQTDPAKALLDQIESKPELDAVWKESLLARGREWLGDRSGAEAHYRQAAGLSADDPEPHVRLAEFLLRTRPGDDRAEPERLLREVLEKHPKFALARRLLAELLIEHGGEKEWSEAVRLVEATGDDRASTAANRRLQASILARRGGKDNLEKAVRIFEELAADPKTALPSDRLQLAKLHEAQGNVESARRQLLEPASRENPSAGHLAALIEFLLRNEKIDEAAAWLDKLDALAPGDPVATALRIRWLHAANRDGAIEPLVETLAEKLLKQATDAGDKPREAAVLLNLGGLEMSVERYPAAERWYRRLMELEPERYEPLVGALARQGRMRDALELCRKAAETDPSTRPAFVAASALLEGKPAPDDFSAAEPLFAKTLAEHPDDATWLSMLAGVRVVENRVDDAVGLYRKALAVAPRNVALLNNLATLLAEQPGDEVKQEALRHIDRAIEIVGPQPGLLDTKGMILVFQGKPAEAVPLLEEASARPQADPRYPFHLAAAYDRIGESDKARDALKTALKGNLAGQVLTPLDRTLLTELEKKYIAP